MGGNNTPLQGGKFADLEGGTRATAFVSGGLLPAARRGSSESGYIHAADWCVVSLRVMLPALRTCAPSFPRACQQRIPRSLFFLSRHFLSCLV